MPPSLHQYIVNLRDALASPGARQTYFPMNADERKSQLIHLGHDIGFGLRDFPSDEVTREMGGLYSTIVVTASFDSVGVVLSAREWVKALRDGMADRTLPMSSCHYEEESPDSRATPEQLPLLAP